jgi:hypothetical protein
MGASGTQQFTAVVSNTSNPAVTWSVTPSAGTITASGLYTAPATLSGAQTVTVTATSVADATKTSSAVVALTVPVSVTVSPGTATMGASGTQQFTAVVSNTSNTAVTWSVTPSVGTITAAGLYTAPATLTVAQTVTVTATSVADSTKSSSAVVTLTPSVQPATAFNPIRVNAGGASYTDSQGNVWSADAGFSGVATWSVSNPISNTTTPALYQSCRYGNSFSYQFAAPNGTYTAVLKFAEISQTAAGKRVFDVAINGVQVLTNFDVFASAGGEFIALDKSFPVTVTNGQIDIQFNTTGINSPLINALQITSGSTAPATVAFNPVRVNAGGAAYTDSQGNVWSADTGFSGGAAWSVSNPISNTITPALYQTCRYGNGFSYQFAAPNGTYTVLLKFAEVSQTAAGKRVFNVAINGVQVLTNFDVFASAGGEFIALDKSFPVSVTNGQVNIQFISTGINSPLINAIQITQ